MAKSTKKILKVIMVVLMLQVAILPFKSSARERWDQSKWMQQQYNSIKDKALNQLALPGTHDTLTYNLDKNSWDQINNGFTDFIKLEQWPVLKDIIYNYSHTQQANLYDQMVEGNRYLDLRLKKDKQGHIRGYHGMFGDKVHGYVFAEIGRFLNNNPSEIVIVDLQALNNLSADDMRYLNDQINQYLGGKLANRDELKPTNTVKEFLDKGARVIILADDQTLLNANKGIWHRSSNIISNWKNTGDVNGLLQHISADLVNKNNSKFYVSQMVLSPNLDEILDKVKNSAKLLPIPIYGQIQFGQTLGELAGNSLYKMIVPHNGQLDNWVRTHNNLNITMRDFYSQGHILETINKNK